MDRDDITDAFARWKLAHDAFLIVEQRFFDTVGQGADQTPSKMLYASDPLFAQVQAKRAHAEELLLAAMKLLHEQRHAPDTPRRSNA